MLPTRRKRSIAMLHNEVRLCLSMRLLLLSIARVQWKINVCHDDGQPAPKFSQRLSCSIDCSYQSVST